MTRFMALGATTLMFLLVIGGTADATAVDLTFENIAPYPNNSNVQIENYYNGGTSSIGTGGTNYGISFSSDALLVCLNTSQDGSCSDASRGGLGDSNSQEGALYFNENSGTLNDAAGFTSGVTFEYASLYQIGTAQVWSGLGGTGTLLGSVTLNPDSGSCVAYLAVYCPLSLAGINFTGTAKSIVFTGTPGEFVFDDIMLSSLFTGTLPPPPPLPEPATWALMLTGFGLIGALRRRRGLPAVALA